MRFREFLKEQLRYRLCFLLLAMISVAGHAANDDLCGFGKLAPSGSEPEPAPRKLDLALVRSIHALPSHQAYRRHADFHYEIEKLVSKSKGKIVTKVPEALKPFSSSPTLDKKQLAQIEAKARIQLSLLTQVSAYDEQRAMGNDTEKAKKGAQFMSGDDGGHTAARNAAVYAAAEKVAADSRVPEGYRDFLNQYLLQIKTRDLPPHGLLEAFLKGLEL